MKQTWWDVAELMKHVESKTVLDVR
jgi:hypothetical protein